jgi:hypothetical protein
VLASRLIPYRERRRIGCGRPLKKPGKSSACGRRSGALNWRALGLKSRRLRVPWFLAVSLLAALVSGEAEKPCQIVESLREAKSEAEMDEEINRFARQKLALVQDLISLLRETRRSSVRVRACYLLGELRDPRATRALADHLLLEADVPAAITKRPRWGPFPCQEALIKIGKPVESQLMKILADPSRAEAMKAAALHVLQSIEGWRGAVYVLEQELEGADSAAREGLEKALVQARKRTH